jgi:hypothetical protein
MFESWAVRSGSKTKEFLNRVSDHRMLVSFKKGRALGDLFAVWNASLTRTFPEEYEEYHADEDDDVLLAVPNYVSDKDSEDSDVSIFPGDFR